MPDVYEFYNLGIGDPIANFEAPDTWIWSPIPQLYNSYTSDNFDKFMPDVYEFYNMGIGDPIPVSAASMLGIGDMLDQ